MFRFRSFAIVVFTLTALLGCKKPINVRWFNYSETKCADRWEWNMNNERLKDNVVTYLGTKGVKVLEIEIFIDSASEECQACTCKSGRRIKCKVKRRDFKAIEKEGFVEQ